MTAIMMSGTGSSPKTKVKYTKTSQVGGPKAGIRFSTKMMRNART
jgi:hypothetical protein